MKPGENQFRKETDVECSVPQMLSKEAPFVRERVQRQTGVINISDGVQSEPRHHDGPQGLQSSFFSYGIGLTSANSTVG